MSETVGRVIGTEDATPLEFWVVAAGSHLQLDDVVAVTRTLPSDVNLATYLLLDACKKRCEIAVVISNDSDLAEAIRVAQTDMGIKVGLINPHPRHRLSRRLHALQCRFLRQIPQQALVDAQLPDIVLDSQGEIRKPTGW